MMYGLKKKDIEKKIDEAVTLKQSLEKKKKKLQNKVLVMPKSEEIRTVTDNIKIVVKEVDELKKEVAMKEKAIRFIKKGNNELPIND